MSNKQFIQIAEMSEDDESITRKWKSMKFLEKLVCKIFTPAIDEMKKSFNQSMQRLSQENEKLRQDLNDLSEKYDTLSKQVNIDSKKTAVLLAEYNTKKASSNSKYKAAINVLYP